MIIWLHLCLSKRERAGRKGHQGSEVEFNQHQIPGLATAAIYRKQELGAAEAKGAQQHDTIWV